MIIAVAFAAIGVLLVIMAIKGTGGNALAVLGIGQ